MAKLVVVGIDGASFNFLTPMTKKGDMPNLKRLMRGGCYGVLKSQIPYSTCPVWKSYSTGKNYGKLGVYGWINVDCKNKRMYVNTASRMQSKEIWDCLSDKGKKVCIINAPLTYPPKKVNGYMVSGTIQGRIKNYTYPEEFQQEIEKKFGYRLPHTALPLEKLSEELENETMKVIGSRFAVALGHVNEVDFMHVGICRTDAIMHFHWGSEFMDRVFRFIDKQIGLLWRAAGSECDFIVMSDHGFTKATLFFNGNTWLKQKGYLVEKRSLGDVFNAIGVSRNLLYNVANWLGVTPLVKRIVPKNISKRIKSKHGQIGIAEMGHFIDWENTKVICQPYGAFYINMRGRDKKAMSEKLATELLGLRHPETGERIIEKVFKKDELYRGGKTACAPDLAVLPRDGVKISGTLGPTELFSMHRHWKGIHTHDGMFVFNGKSFEKRRGMQEANILDMMPTILHLMGCPVPKNIDGRVLNEFFAEKRRGGKNTSGKKNERCFNLGRCP
jgi:predicted AlkP superfamily phosphohydrolase/phosphomutase